MTPHERSVPASSAWATSWWICLRAYGWLLGVTLPATIVLGGLIALVPSVARDLSLTVDWSVSGGAAIVWWVVLVDFFTAIFAFGAVLVAWPLTWALGRTMRRVRSRLAHVLATSALAGVLAAVPLAFSLDSLVLFGPMSVAAGAAGALARRGEFRRSDRMAATAAAAVRPEVVVPGAATAVVPAVPPVAPLPTGSVDAADEGPLPSGG